MLLRKICSLFFIGCSLCSVCLFSPATIPAAHASSSPLSNPITLVSHAYRIAFPQYINFSVMAVDTSSNITMANLFITFNVTFNNAGEMYDSSGTPEQHSVAIAHPAQTVSLSWQEHTDGSTFFAPGTQVDYYWRLQDSAGNTYTEAQQQFITTDSRFTWSHLSQGVLQVNWYNQPASFGAALLSDGVNEIARISHVLGGIPHTQINLWAYSSDSDFHGALPPNVYEWVGGIAYPLLDEAVVVVATPSDTTVIRDMPHELTHIIFYQLTAQGIEAPVWFNEGLAVYNQSYHEQDMTDRFNQALNTHTLIRLSDLQTRFPASADQAELAYAQSWNLVNYMFKIFGGTRMQQFVQKLANPRTTFDQDMTQAFGMDSVHLENQWRLSLNQPAILSPQQPTQPKKPQRPTEPSAVDIGPSVAILFGSIVFMIFLVLLAYTAMDGSRRATRV